MHAKQMTRRLTWLLLWLTVAACAGCSKDAATLLAAAQQASEKGDHGAAIIQLKNALQMAPDNGETRYLLGSEFNALRDGRSAEAELRRARDLGAVVGGKVAVQLGRALLLNRNYAAALKEIGPNPSFEDSALADIHAVRGRAHLGLGQMSQAKTEFEEASRLQPDHSEAMVGLAALKMIENDVDGASAIMDQVLAKNPKYYDALMLKGDLARSMSQNDAAIAAYQRAIEIVPNQIGPRFSKAALLIELGKLDEAQKDVEAMGKQAKNNPLVGYLQALILFRQNKYREAQDASLGALKYAPDFAPLQLLAGAINFALGSFAQAEKHLSQFLRDNPNNIYARKLLASTLNEMNQSKRAMEVIEPALRKDVQDAVALALAGNTELRMGDFSKAITYWEKAVAISPKNAQLRYSLAMSRLTSGDTERAITDLEVAAGLDPKDAKADLFLATTLLKQRQFDRAIEAIRAVEKKVPNNPLVYNLLGVAYVSKGDFANARKSFEQSIAINPKFVGGAANLALLDLQEGKGAQARERFEKILAQDKDNVQALMALAGLSARANRRDEAITLLERAVKAQPAAIQARATLVDQYLAAGEPVKALQEAQAAERNAQGPNQPSALDLLGMTQMAIGKPADAVLTFEKLVTVVPDSPVARFRLASARVATKSPDAEAEFRKALQLSPGYAEASSGLAMLLVRSGKFDQAIKVAEQLRQANPKSGSGYELEGEVLMEQKKYAPAVRAYQNALKIAPNGQTTIKTYMAEARAGNLRGATARLEQWLREHPEDLPVRAYLADAMMVTGRPKEAAEQYQFILQRNPNDLLVMNNLANVYHTLKDPRALAIAEKAHELKPENPLITDTLGWILLGVAGQTTRAVELLESAASQATDMPVIRYHLAVALAKSGNKQKARSELERALAMTTLFAEREQAKTLLKEL